MEAVEFLGITFRSSYHMQWFVMTMIIFGASWVLFGICLVCKCYGAPVIIWGILGIMSLSASMGAITKTKWGTVNGPVYSVDCIWYNGLLMVIYFSSAGIYVLLRDYRKRRRLRKEGAR